LPYSPEEIELLRLCDGTTNVQEMIRKSLDGEYLVLRRLMNLWTKGAIRPKDEERLEKEEGVHRLSLGGLDWLNGIWVIIWVAALGIILSVLEGLSPPVMIVPTTLTQAVEVFRHKQGHYPLSLEELASEPALHGLPIRQYDYTLVRSDEYRITIKR
jgi:hypothetical protein